MTHYLLTVEGTVPNPDSGMKTPEAIEHVGSETSAMQYAMKEFDLSEGECHQLADNGYFNLPCEKLRIVDCDCDSGLHEKEHRA